MSWLSSTISADEQELERLRREGGNDEELQEVSHLPNYLQFRIRLTVKQINQLQDKLAGTQLDLDSRDQEIDELNKELDIKIRNHEKELEMVADEWRDEVAEARAQVEELKDVRRVPSLLISFKVALNVS
jgi:chromosome segregation ATPase